MGRYNKMLAVVDTHTGGQPTRTIIGGMPRLKGNTMSEKMLYMRDNLDHIRIMLTSEPRGNPATSATSVAVLTEPTDPTADIGAFFCEYFGYMPMCGHDTIGVCTMLVENGMVNVTEPYTNIRMEVPAGIIEARVCVEQGRAKSVSFKNAPSFVYGLDMDVEYEGKRVVFDVAYGGNFYAIIPANSLGIELMPENYRLIVHTGLALIDIINEKYEVMHPEKQFIRGVNHIQFTNPIEQDGGGLKSKNCVVVRPGAVDRSPCGTGTSARVADLYTRGVLELGQTLKHRSLIDSLFEAKALESLDYFGYKAVIPEITGSAYITGMSTVLLDPQDEKGYGFTLM